MRGVRRALAVTAAVLSLGAIASEASGARDGGISVFDLAERIIDGTPVPTVIDLRPVETYRRFHVPSAMSASLRDLVTHDLPRNAAVIVYSDERRHAVQGRVLLRLRGYRDVAYLRGGIHAWLVQVHDPWLAENATPSERREHARAAAFSRYFGGEARHDVPRDDVARRLLAAGTDDIVNAVRRRGC